MSALPPDASLPPAYANAYDAGGDPPETSWEYHQLHRGGRWGDNGWWRGLVGIPVVAISYLVLNLLLGLGLVTYYVASGMTSEELLDFGRELTPGLLLVTNLGWGAMIGVVWLVVRLLHGLRPGWVASVVPRIRWRFLLVCAGLALIALVARIVAGSIVPATAGEQVSGELNPFTSTVRAYLIIIVLTTPLQAIGEEYVFRGYLTQAVGSWFRSAKVATAAAVAVPALLFALAHGLTQSFPIFFDRLAFGVVFGLLVILTGGLEAAIAMHVLNNFLAFGAALAFGDISSAITPTGGSWWTIPVTLVHSVVYVALAVWAARRMGLATTTGDRLTPASRLVPPRTRM